MDDILISLLLRKHDGKLRKHAIKGRGLGSSVLDCWLLESTNTPAGSHPSHAS